MKKVKSLLKHKHSKSPPKENHDSVQRDSMQQNMLYDDHGGAIIGRRKDPIKN